jgi:hypothetical protein
MSLWGTVPLVPLCLGSFRRGFVAVRHYYHQTPWTQA